MDLINVKSLFHLHYTAFLEYCAFYVFVKEFISHFTSQIEKNKKCISLGETSSYTIKPRTFCLRTWSHNNSCTIAEAENAGILAPLILNFSNTATWVPLSHFLPKRYTTTLRVSLPDVLSAYWPLCLVATYLSKCLVKNALCCFNRMPFSPYFSHSRLASWCHSV